MNITEEPMNQNLRVLFTMLAVSFFLSLNIETATAGDLVSCLQECGKRLKKCAEKTDIGTACEGIEACKGLEEKEIKVTNSFCDECAEGGRDCPSVTATPPPVVAPVAPAPKPPVPVAPLTDEQRCRVRGGVLFEGKCITLADVKKDVEALKRNSATKEEVEALKKRLDALPAGQGGGIDELEIARLRSRIQDQIDGLAETDRGLSQRQDRTDQRLAKLEQEDEGDSFFGCQVNVFGDVHSLKPYDELQYALGVEARWLPGINKHFSLLGGVGTGFAGHDEDDEKLAMVRVEIGGAFHIAGPFHLATGFVTDHVFDGHDRSDASFIGGFVEPELCYPRKGVTPCLGLSLAPGASTFPSQTTDELFTEFDLVAGAHLGIAYFP